MKATIKNHIAKRGISTAKAKPRLVSATPVLTADEILAEVTGLQTRLSEWLGKHDVQPVHLLTRALELPPARKAVLSNHAQNWYKIRCIFRALGKEMRRQAPALR